MANLLTFNRFATLPARNFQASHFDGAERLAAEDLGPARRIARNSCAACTIGWRLSTRCPRCFSIPARIGARWRSRAYAMA